MTKSFRWIAPMALGIVFCAVLRADDSTPPGASGPGDTWQSRNESVWWMEHTTAIATSADSSSVQAVILARDLMKQQSPQAALDFFNKAVYEVKNRAAQRQIRFTLFELYRDQGQTDKAMDQLQQVMMDQ